jgi:hypothetical protein
MRIVLAGWAGMLLLAALFVPIEGMDEARSAIVFGLIALGMGSWVWRRGSRPALVVSLVLGVLQTAEQVAYTIADVGYVLDRPAVLVGTVVGLIAGICLVVGSTLELAARRRTRRAMASGET